MLSIPLDPNAHLTRSGEGELLHGDLDAVRLESLENQGRDVLGEPLDRFPSDSPKVEDRIPHREVIDRVLHVVMLCGLRDIQSHHNRNQDSLLRLAFPGRDADAGPQFEVGDGETIVAHERQQ